MFFWKLHVSSLTAHSVSSVFTCLSIIGNPTYDWHLNYSPSQTLHSLHPPPRRLSTIILPHSIWFVLFLVHCCLGSSRPFKVCRVPVVASAFYCKPTLHRQNTWEEWNLPHPLMEAVEHEFIFVFATQMGWCWSWRPSRRFSMQWSYSTILPKWFKF